MCVCGQVLHNSTAAHCPVTDSGTTGPILFTLNLMQPEQVFRLILINEILEIENHDEKQIERQLQYLYFGTG